MGQWKKILTSGSAAEVTTLEATSTVVFSGIGQDTSPSNLISSDADGNITYTPSSNFMPSSGGSTAGEFIFWSGSLSEYGTTSSTTTAATNLIKFVSSGGGSPRPELVITGSLQGDVDGNAATATSATTAATASYVAGSNVSGAVANASNAVTASYITYANVDNTPTIGNGTVTMAGGAGLSIGETDKTFSMNQTGNQTITFNVDSTVVRTSGAQIISGSKTFHNDATFDGDVTVEGNLTITGTSTIIDTTNLMVEDKFITLASGSTAGNTNGGLIVATGVVSGSTTQKGDAFYRTSTGRWGYATDVAENATLVGAEAYAPAIQIIHTGDPVNPDSAPTVPAYGLGDMYMDRATGELFVWTEALGSSAPSGGDPGTGGGGLGDSGGQVGG